MAIFPHINTDVVAQVGDMVRIDLGLSLVAKSNPAATAVLVRPEAAGDQVDVFSATRKSDWYLDWVYLTAGDKIIDVDIFDGTDNWTLTQNISILTAADDKLFSNDADLLSVEFDLMRYLKDGRNNYNWAHRAAQEEILEQLYKDGYRGHEGAKITKAEVVDIEEFRQWSTYAALRIVYNSVSNSLDDVFSRKSGDYRNEEHKWRTKAVLKIDLNADGSLDTNEGINITSRRLIQG